MVHLGLNRCYSWVPPDVPDLAGVLIRHSTREDADWEDMEALQAGQLTSSPYYTPDPRDAGVYWFEARAINTAGGLSATGSRVMVELPKAQTLADIEADSGAIDSSAQGGDAARADALAARDDALRRHGGAGCGRRTPISRAGGPACADGRGAPSGEPRIADRRAGN